MKFLAITTDTFFPEETNAVNQLFEQGLPLLHLRKPTADKSELCHFLECLTPEFLSRIVLNDHFELSQEFPVRGIHLNGRNPQRPSFLVGSVSRSCHSLEELAEARKECDYLFLSPIFNSISKVGYQSQFTPEQLRNAKRNGVIDDRVYALGGVSEQTLPAALEMGFSRAALLGALWRDFPADKDLDKLIARLRFFMNIKE